MNTFFRICVFICFSLIIFNFVFALIDGLGAFPYESSASVYDESDIIGQITGLTDPNMNAIWLGVTTLSFLGVVVLAAATHSVIPIGLHLFGTIFWTSWIHTQSIFSDVGYLSSDLIAVFTIGVMFVFIAAIIGILTGSG